MRSKNKAVRFSKSRVKNMLKVTLLYLMKFCGGFTVARLLTRRSLRILCYHGISISDESAFRQRLFMQRATFRQRMEYLARSGCVVLPLAEALDRLQDGSLPPCCVSITLDDGWLGCREGAFPVLRELGLPATLYVTSYCVFRRTHVFDVLVGYLFWKTKVRSLELGGLCDGLEGRLDLSSDARRQIATDVIVEYGNDRLTCEQRINLARGLAARLNVDYREIDSKGLFRLLSPEDLESLAGYGFDIQLHTHRHRFDITDRARAQLEILENRKRLEPIAGKRLEHFCYPSGVYHSRVWPWLAELGIRSATTTAAGFCTRSTPPYAIPRIVDGEGVSMIEFEAEVMGALELIRRVRSSMSVTNLKVSSQV